MAESRKGIVFEHNQEEGLRTDIVRKSATKSRLAHYQLKHNHLEFEINDIIDENNPIVIDYFGDENRIFIGSKPFSASKKHLNKIIYKSNEKDEMVELTSVKDGLAVVVTIKLNDLENGFPVKLDSVGILKINDDSVSLMKDKKTVYHINDVQALSSLDTPIPLTLELDKESDTVSTFLIKSLNEQLVEQDVTLKFSILSASQIPISSMSSFNLNWVNVAPRPNNTYRVGRYADASRVTRSNANTLNIRINPEYIRDEVNLKPLVDFSLILRLYHFTPVVSSLAKRRTGYNISVRYMPTRKIVPTVEGELLIDLTETLRQCLANNNWSPFDVSIRTADSEMYARLSGSQSGISDILTTDDYFDICNLNYQDTSRRPTLFFEYSDLEDLEETTPFLEVDNAKSGSLSVNNFTGDFTFKHHDTIVNSANLSIELFHLFSSVFTRTAYGSNNNFGLGVGWKTNLHQWLQKTPYDPEKKEIKIIYTDGFGVNHIFYEKWYYELNNVKHYVDRNAVYVDELGELKFKANASSIYSVTYEVKSKDGLTLATSAGMFEYRDKTKFTNISRTYYDDVNKKLSLNGNDLSLSLFSTGAPTESLKFNNTEIKWLNDNQFAVANDVNSNVFKDLFWDFVWRYSRTQSSQLPTARTLLTPIFYKDDEYYTKFPRAKKQIDMRDQYQNRKVTEHIEDDYEQIDLRLETHVAFDTTLLDYYETEEMVQLKQQIEQYDDAIKESKENAENVSSNLESAIDSLEEIKKSKARIYVSINQLALTYNYNQTESDLYDEAISMPQSSWPPNKVEQYENAISIVKPFRIASYSYQGSLNQLTNQIESAENQVESIKQSLAKLFKNIDEYQITRDNLNDKLQGLIKKQKLSPTDFITDESGNILGFDFHGRLILIADKFEKTIRINFKEDKDLFDTIETEHGVIRFNYHSNDLLKEIIDVDGKTTLFEYSNNKLLSTIKYDKFTNHDTKFEYKNEMLSKVIDASGLNLFIGYILGKTDVKQTTTTKTINNDGLQKLVGLPPKEILDTTLIKNELQSTLTNHINGSITTYEFDEKGRLLSSVSTLGSQTDYAYAKYNDHGDVTISSSYAKKHVLAKFIENNVVLTQNRTIEFSDEKNQSGKIWRGDILNSDTLVYYLEFTSISNGTIILDIEAIYTNNQRITRHLTIYNNQKHILVPVAIDKDMISDIKITHTDASALRNFGLATGFGEFNKYDEDDNLIQNKNGLTVTRYLDYEKKQPSRVETIDKYNKELFQQFSYNDKQQLTFSEDQDGNVEERFYADSGELLESVTYNKKEATNKTVNKYEYDEVGNIAEINGLLPNKEGKINPEKQTYYPGTKKLNYVTAPNGLVTSYGFDFYNGNLLSKSAAVDGIGNTTNYNYQYGLLTALSHQEFDIHYEYDGQGRKTAVDVACNNIVKFKYDDEYMVDGYKGSKTETEYYNNGTLENKITVIKSINGLTKQMTYTSGIDIEYQYDAFDRLVGTDSGQERTSIEYDYKNNIKYNDIEYDSFGKISFSNEYTWQNLLESTLTKVDDTSELYKYRTRYIYDTLDRVVQTHINLNGTPGKSDEKLNNEYDAINRVIKERIHLKDSNDPNEKYQLLANEYLYLKSDNQATNLIKKNFQTVLNSIKDVTNYNYDEMGNIIQIENDDNHITYIYDKLGRVIRENNQKLNITKTFEYDESGNILRSRQYAYTKGELGIPLVNNRYSYNQGNYQDQLVDFNGEAIVYDGLGRPTTYRDKSLVWSPNSTLSQYENFNYTYNNQGIRIRKVVGDTTHKYFVNGTKILLEELITNSTSKYLKYKYFGDKLFGFNYDNIDYYYIRNIQGDVTSIIDKDGIEVASYTYDAWGNHVVNNYTGDNIGDINPFRYRGYYFDVETKLYYLNTRYYDPETGRFISQDNISYLEPDMINGLNLYAYCGNNPVMYLDPSGNMPQWLKWTIGFGIILGLGIAALTIGGAVIIGASIGAIVGGSVGIIGGISFDENGFHFDSDKASTGFMFGTITGAVSGALGAKIGGISKIGTFAQRSIMAGIDGSLSLGAYLGQAGLHGEQISLGGVLISIGSGLFSFAEPTGYKVFDAIWGPIMGAEIAWVYDVFNKFNKNQNVSTVRLTPYF